MTQPASRNIRREAGCAGITAMPTIPPEVELPPYGPARAAYFRQLRRTLALDAHNQALRMVGDGMSESEAVEAVRAQLLTFVVALDAEVTEAVAVARWAA